MKAILIQLQLISAIPAQNLNATHSTDDHPGGRRPPGDEGHLLYARWYGPPFMRPTPHFPGCKTVDEKQECITAARAELHHLRKTSHRDDLETPERTREELLHETEGWSPQAVAQSHWRLSVSVLRRIRVAAGRDAETGRPVELAQTTGQDLESRARELNAQGLSQRQIGMVLNISQPTVSRLLGRRVA